MFTDDISDILEEKFRSKVPWINEFVQQHDLVVRLNGMLEIDPEQTPVISFNADFIIKMLVDLNAEIDMDIEVIELTEEEKEALI